MNFDILVLFLHIIGAAGLFLGLGIEGVTLKFLSRASTTEQVLGLGPSFKLLRITFSVSALLLLLPGIYMVERGWGWSGWVIVGLIMLVVLSGAGSMGGKKIGELMKSLSNSTGTLSSEVREKLSASFLHKSYKTRIILVIGTMFIMTMKTDWLMSIVTILIAFLIGLLITGMSGKSQEAA
jgi:ABC-type multidrug transport system fused ATPase/permease subunit